jgi:hypothetical protein
VKEIPSNNQITRLLDKVAPEGFDKNFKNCIKQAETYGVLDRYKVLEAKLDPQNHAKYSRYVSRIYNFISPIHMVFTPGGPSPGARFGPPNRPR